MSDDMHTKGGGEGGSEDGGEPDGTISPEWSHRNYQSILDWARNQGDFNLTWSDEAIDDDGFVVRQADFACWSMSWKGGVIGWDCLPEKDDQVYAEMAAAMFIYLWTRGVAADVADLMSGIYALQRKHNKLVISYSD